MADRVKGITVVLGGDTTGLNKALAETNKEIKSTQAQLKDVERLLKLDPSNTKLLEQRQRLLADAVGETRKKLDTLKQAEKQVQEQFKKGEVSQQQYDGLQREIAATEQELRNLETQAYKSNSAVAKIGDAAGKVKTGADKISSAAGSVQQAFAPVTAAVAGLAGAAVATIPATEELRSDLSKLEASAEDNAVSAEAARDAWREFAVQSGETDSAVEATANLLQAGFTESNLQKAVEGLAGAAQRFPDTLKIEGLADSLQETLATGSATGQFGELLDRLGIGAENFRLCVRMQRVGGTNSIANTSYRGGADVTRNKQYGFTFISPSVSNDSSIREIYADISSAKGEYYIIISCGGGNNQTYDNFRIYEVWLA